MMATFHEVPEAGETMQMESMKFKEEEWKELGEITLDISLNDLHGEEHEELEGWDDVSGKKLDAKMVLKVRKEEIDFFRKHGVYKRVPKGPIRVGAGKKPITTF